MRTLPWVIVAALAVALVITARREPTGPAPTASGPDSVVVAREAEVARLEAALAEARRSRVAATDRRPTAEGGADTPEPARAADVDDARELEVEVARLRAEVAARDDELRRLRGELDRRRTTAMLHFPAAKGGGEVTYVGEMASGLAEGFGYGVWSTGSSYEGEWRQGRRHGRGTFIWPDKERYVGEFVEDRRTGEGTYFWTTGQRWEGTWLDDMRQGEGVLYEPNGKVRLRGIWDRDKLAREIRQQAP